MKKLLILLGFVLLISCTYAYYIPKDVPVQIQVEQYGAIVAGTFNFTLNYSNTPDCNNVDYSYTTTQTTDWRGIVYFNMVNFSINPNNNYTLCYYRDGVLKSNVTSGSSIYALYAENVTWSGVIGKPINLSQFYDDINSSSSYNATYNIWAYNQTDGAIVWVESQNYISNGTNAWLNTLAINKPYVSNGFVLDIDGDVRINGNLDVLANITNLNIQNLNINGSIIPQQDNIFDLGNSTNQWMNGYFGTDVYIQGNSINKWMYNQSEYAITTLVDLLTPFSDNWYNHTSAVEGLYGKWFYNMSDGSYNSTYDKYAYNQTSNLTDYVPYEGANHDINITTFNLYANNITLNGSLRLLNGKPAGTPLLYVGDDVYLADLDIDGVMGIYGSRNNRGGIKLGGTGVEIYYNDSNLGNLGINTRDPQEDLTLGTHSLKNVKFLIDHDDGDSNSGIMFRDGLNYGFDIIDDSSNNILKINSTSVDSIMTFIRQTGYVGLGTINPSQKLDVRDTSYSGSFEDGLIIATRNNPSYNYSKLYMDSINRNNSGGAYWIHYTDPDNAITGYKDEYSIWGYARNTSGSTVGFEKFISLRFVNYSDGARNSGPVNASYEKFISLEADYFKVQDLYQMNFTGTTGKLYLGTEEVNKWLYNQTYTPNGSGQQIAFFSSLNNLSGSNKFLWNDATGQLTLNRNTANASAPTIAGTAFRINGADNEMVRIGITAYGIGGTSGFSVRGARGNGSAPTASQLNDLLGQFDSYGRMNDTAWSPTPKAIIKMVASNNFNSTAQGTMIQFWTTARNSIVPSESFRIDDGNMTNYGNLYTTGNITSNSYIYGQPITGSIGSGIIWANGTNNFAEVKVNCTGLSCTYTAFKVRLVNTSNVEKYCDIPGNTMEIQNNQHSVLYVDNNCQVQQVSIQNFINTPLSPGGIADFGNVIAFNGSTYNPNGIGTENKRIIKLRKLLLQSDGKHLSVVDGGFNEQQNTFPQFNITSGQYTYLMDIVTASKKQTSIDNLEIIYHTNATAWAESDQQGLNLTLCDTGSGTTACTVGTGSNTKYRRYFIYMVGYNESGVDHGQLHQTAGLLNTFYSTLSSCMDITTNPLVYNIPDFYQYGAVPLYAYCARADDTSWNTNAWIDLRTVKSVSSSAIVDTTNLVPYTGANANVDLGIYNISASLFKGNWNNSILYVTYNGATTNINIGNNNITANNLNTSGNIYLDNDALITRSGTNASLGINSNSKIVHHWK